MATRQIAPEPPAIVCMCFIYLCIYINGNGNYEENVPRESAVSGQNSK